MAAHFMPPPQNGYFGQKEASDQFLKIYFGQFDMTNHTGRPEAKGQRPPWFTQICYNIFLCLLLCLRTYLMLGVMSLLKKLRLKLVFDFLENQLGYVTHNDPLVKNTCTYMVWVWDLGTKPEQTY